MITIEEMEVLLDDIAAGIPQDLYKNLNGGILLLPEKRLHEKSHDSSNLYVMGEYHRDAAMGRYIAIYYGSFVQVYGNLHKDLLIEELTKTLKHEFRHHLESMAGDKSLEIRDAEDLYAYLDRRPRHAE